MQAGACSIGSLLYHEVVLWLFNGNAVQEDVRELGEAVRQEMIKEDIKIPIGRYTN
jgi:hypothetical protein